MTIRIARRLFGKRAKTGVLLAGPPARARRDDRQRDRLEVADDRNEREEERGEAEQQEDDGRPARRAAAAKRPAYERRRADAPPSAPPIAAATASGQPKTIQPSTPAITAARNAAPTAPRGKRPTSPAATSPIAVPAPAESPIRYASPICPASVDSRRRFTSGRDGDGRLVRSDARLPTLVFFTQATSGPARRMESLLAHVARKERERLIVRRVDAESIPISSRGSPS